MFLHEPSNLITYHNIRIIFYVVSDEYIFKVSTYLTHFKLFLFKFDAKRFDL